MTGTPTSVLAIAAIRGVIIAGMLVSRGWRHGLVGRRVITTFAGGGWDGSTGLGNAPNLGAHLRQPLCRLILLGLGEATPMASH